MRHHQPSREGSSERAVPVDGASHVDRLFMITLSISLAGHAVIFGAQLMHPGWVRLPSPPTPLKLVYEQDARQEATQWTREELRRAQERLKNLPDPSSTPLHEGVGASRQWEEQVQGALASGLSNLEPQIRVGDSAGVYAPSMSIAESGAWASAIDLTNVTAAAQGNPVLLSYFGAIRERIQRTANERAWLPSGEVKGGVIYVGFSIGRSGEIDSIAVVPDRSVDSPLLRQTALHIIESSSPFLPFPPSLQESSKTVVVPIEFSLGP